MAHRAAVARSRARARAAHAGVGGRVRARRPPPYHAGHHERGVVPAQACAGGRRQRRRAAVFLRGRCRAPGRRGACCRARCRRGAWVGAVGGRGVKPRGRHVVATRSPREEKSTPVAALRNQARECRVRTELPRPHAPCRSPTEASALAQPSPRCWLPATSADYRHPARCLKPSLPPQVITTEYMNSRPRAVS
ncbi:hypothetical protein CC85DRAFT_328519, partial [Cutaneotrichosporon oleaginosum]